MSEQTIDAISGRFDTNSGAEPERGEIFGEMIRFDVKDDENTEVENVKDEIDKAFGCDAGFRLFAEKNTDCESVIEGVELETANFGFLTW